MSTGWKSFNEAVATARAELSSAAPDEATAAEAEDALMRLTAASLGDVFLSHQLTEGGLSRPIPTLGGPNPDYILSSAPIDPASHYRLKGCLHDSERVGVGLYSIGAGGAMLLDGYAVFDRRSVAADGCFALELAAGADGPGTLAIPADCRVLIVRTLHRDPRGRPCTLTLEGSAMTPRLEPARGSAEAALAQAGQRVLGTVKQFIEWSRLISANPNRFITPPESIAAAVRGDPDTGYYFGYYQLRDGECLEVLMPEGVPGYWSLHAYNHWLESLPGAGFHDLNATPDSDGRIRLQIGPSVQRGSNPVNTQGRRRGALIYRTIGDEQVRIPEARVVDAGAS